VNPAFFSPEPIAEVFFPGSGLRPGPARPLWLDVGKTVLVERAVTTAYLIELVGVASNSVQIGLNKEKYNVGF
jgi:hypothetical protein